MDRYDEHNGTTLIAGFILAGVIMLISVWLSAKACDARWPDRDHEWNLLAGCMVKGDSGEILPEDKIRFVAEEGLR